MTIHVRPATRADADAWAIAQHCREFGSDAILENHTSAAAHVALGFTETVQLRCFKKTLTPQLSDSDHE